METTSHPDLVLATRGDMVAEARRVIDAARERGLVLRLFGGLAVRAHCTVIGFCERDYADIDVVGRRSQSKELRTLMLDLGYAENLHVRQATNGRQLQFYRECTHADAQAHFFVHPDDHIDVFLDTFKMDHEVNLNERLTIEDYTISATDALLTKLQIFALNDKDMRDVLTLLKDLPLGEDDRPGVINVASIAARCAADWGLYHDVTTNLQRCAGRLGEYEITIEESEHVRQGLARLTDALEKQPKSRSWRRRAKVGTRRSWRNVIEEQE